MTQLPHADDASDSDTGSSEHEPLLSPGAPAAPPQAFLESRLARRAAALLGACLAAASLVLGAYVLYILVHAPALLKAFMGSEPELEAATLIDVTEDAVLVAADIRFPRWGRQTAHIPSVNATVYHRGSMVGWMHASDLWLTPAHPRLVLAEAFHIVDPDAMTRLLADAASSQQISINVHARIDLSGFGRLLPTASLRRELAVALPPPLPPVNATVHDIAGPVEDALRGGVTAQAAVYIEAPHRVSANIAAVQLDVRYRNVTVAGAEIGPASVHGGSTGRIPVTINIRPIESSLHEAALAAMARATVAGEGFELEVSGSDPRRYSTAPAWLRRALHNTTFVVSTGKLHLPRPGSLGLDDVVKEVVCRKLYAYWSAEDSYRPWVGVSGEATLRLPNASAANVTLEVESLVPTVRLLDEQQRPFATVDMLSVPVRVRQTGPLEFAVVCDLERVGLSAVPGRELEYTRAMNRAVADRWLAFGVDGVVDVVLATSIGRIHINAMPFQADVDWHFGPRGSAKGALSALAAGAGTDSAPVEVSTTRVHIVNTAPDLVALKIDLAVSNPFSYGAFLTDLALMVKYNGLHIATVGTTQLSLLQGVSNATANVAFHNHPADPRQQEFFMAASSGRSITIEVAGFPNCTSILPLEASLREFSQEVTIDLSDRGGSGVFVGNFPRVVREVVFRIFSMTAEATVVNPVSGADIWLQSIDAVAYYRGHIPLGTLQYDFTAPDPRQHGPPLSGLLLPYGRAVTTPQLPIVANKTSIGWDVVRRAIGGTLDVDVLTNTRVRIGQAQLNVTTMGKNAPIKVRF
ncbi:hypothetical protein H4R19_003612 [Coemansia spiralis]|nr:hypothetical protein H4R19_003612 [Coemansia spiralis]